MLNSTIIAMFLCFANNFKQRGFLGSVKIVTCSLKVVHGLYFVIIDSQQMFQFTCVDKVMANYHTEISILSSNGSLVTAIKLQAKTVCVQPPSCYFTFNRSVMFMAARYLSMIQYEN